MDQGKKNPRFFWVPAIAPLISVILSTLFVYLTRADKHGVAIVSIHIYIYITFLMLNMVDCTCGHMIKCISRKLR